MESKGGGWPSESLNMLSQEQFQVGREGGDIGWRVPS